MIVFSNPGELDVRMLTTMGVSAKMGENPIGFFGTGLKYAIAVLLREKQDVEIWSGTQRLRFGRAIETIRGKDFETVHMMDVRTGEEHRLGFTTELGRNWGLEQAYRELHCNCVDEGGTGGRDEDGLTYGGLAETKAVLHMSGVAQPGQVVVAVRGEEFHYVYLNRWDFLLDPKRTLIHRAKGLEIYAGRSNALFYRGIAAGKIRQSEFTYNLIEPLKLTEDRTIENVYYAHNEIQRAFVTDPTMPEFVLAALAAKDSFEATDLAFHWEHIDDAVRPRLAKLIKRHPMGLNPTILSRYLATAPAGEVMEYEEFVPTVSESETLERGIEFATRIGYPITKFEIKLAKFLGDRVLAKVDRRSQVIWLTPQVLEMGLPELCATLIEEFVHLEWEVNDCTRTMQDRLFQEIVRLGGIIKQHGIVLTIDDEIKF